MKPRVDETACIGCGLCESMCSAVFQLGDDGIARVLGADGDVEANCREAIDACPTGAIVVD